MRVPIAGRTRRLTLALTTVLVGVSCRTPDLPSFETSSGGWKLVTGQAVWTPAKGEAAVAGDFLLATHPDGRLLIDFSKGSLPLAIVRCTARAWRLEVPAEGKAYGGRGRPPARLSWLVLARDLAVEPPPRGWEFDAEGSGVMRLRSTSTGESLELHGWVP